MKAIFLDRDKTVIEDVPYLHKVEDVSYYPCVQEALKLMLDKGYTLFLVTNQSGIGRGLFTLEQMETVHNKIQKDLISWGLPPFKEIVFCPHAPEADCDCRKPNPLMLTGLINKYDIDKSKSFMVGDKDIDPLTGANAGITGIHIADSSRTKFKTYSDILEFAKSL